jgi:hypothetical protein
MSFFYFLSLLSTQAQYFWFLFVFCELWHVVSVVGCWAGGVQLVLATSLWSEPQHCLLGSQYVGC